MTTIAMQRSAESNASGASRAVLAQTRTELTLTLRRGENVLITIVVPVVLLIFFAALGIVPAVNGSPIDFLVPGILSLAIISTGMVNLGISTAYERYYGVLKRLGGSPLPRWGLLAAKAGAVLALEIAQVVLLGVVARFGFGWQPRVELGYVLIGLALGTVAFSAIGLAMAGALRAEATLAIANGLYLLVLLVGDVLLPIDHLPGILQTISRLLPAAALSEVLRASLTGVVVPAFPLLVLAVWAVGISLLAIKTFQWE